MLIYITVINKVYFGELSFTQAAGMDIELMLILPGESKDVDTILGEQLKLK